VAPQCWQLQKRVGRRFARGGWGVGSPDLTPVGVTYPLEESPTPLPDEDERGLGDRGVEEQGHRSEGRELLGLVDHDDGRSRLRLEHVAQTEGQTGGERRPPEASGPRHGATQVMGAGVGGGAGLAIRRTLAKATLSASWAGASEAVMSLAMCSGSAS